MEEEFYNKKFPWKVASDVVKGDAKQTIVDAEGRMVATFLGPNAERNCRFVVNVIQKFIK